MSDLRSALAALGLAVVLLSSLSGRSSARASPTELGAIATSMDEALDAEPMQASCGDGRCSPPEDCRSCPSDCGSCCGDGRCAPPEDARSCPRDCS